MRLHLTALAHPLCRGIPWVQRLEAGYHSRCSKGSAASAPPFSYWTQVDFAAYRVLGFRACTPGSTRRTPMFRFLYVNSLLNSQPEQPFPPPPPPHPLTQPSLPPTPPTYPPHPPQTPSPPHVSWEECSEPAEPEAVCGAPGPAWLPGPVPRRACFFFGLMPNGMRSKIRLCFGCFLVFPGVKREFVNLPLLDI